MRRSNRWRPLGYVALVAIALLLTSSTFDTTELKALAIVAFGGFLAEWLGDLIERKRRGSGVAPSTATRAMAAELEEIRRLVADLKARRCRCSETAPTLAAECAGPYSYTVFDCNGTAIEVETCSPLGTDLDKHLQAHTERVLARAEELGCS